MLLDAQTQPRGIPRVLIEEKKREIAQRQEMEQRRDRPAGGGVVSLEMNPYVVEAAKRAEAARVALEGQGGAFGRRCGGGIGSGED